MRSSMVSLQTTTTVLCALVLLGSIYPALAREADTSVGRSRRSYQQDRPCSKDLKVCRRNSTCDQAFKMVKRKCPTNSLGRCGAKLEDLSTCLESITKIRAIAFQEEDRCTCFISSYTKVKRCTKIYNTVYANACYEKAKGVRDEAIKLAAVTLRAAVATKPDDVTGNSEKELQDAGLRKQNEPPAPTEESIKVEKEVDAADPDSFEKSSDVAKKGRPEPSEEEFMKIDAMFADPQIHRPVKVQEQINIEAIFDDQREYGEKDLPQSQNPAPGSELVIVSPTTEMTTQATTAQTKSEHSSPDRDANINKEIPNILPLEKEKEKEENNYSLVVALTVAGGFAVLLTVMTLGYVYRNRSAQRQPYQPGRFVKNPKFIVRSLSGSKYNCKEAKIFA